MKLRAVLREDLPQLSEIESVCSKNPWGIDMLGEALGLEGAWGLCMEERGKLLGFGLFYHVLDELEVLTLCIAPSHQRKGMGRRLLEEAKRVAREKGARKVSLEVRESNMAALKLYGQLGFLKVGIRKAYYSDGEDAILMDCLLDRGRQNL
jgi:ribosomal-protein-alanine N-acetyltransferase